MDMIDTGNALALEIADTPIHDNTVPRAGGNGSVVIRKATTADARLVSRLFFETYGNPSHPCADQHRLADLLNTRRLELLVAVDRGRIIGSVAASRLRVSGVVEAGCMVVAKDCGRFRVANQLSTRLIEHISQDPSCHLITAFARGPSIHRFLHRHPVVPFRVWGHDGAMNVAMMHREHHVVMIGSNPRATFFRARPDAALDVIERSLGNVSNMQTIAAARGSRWAAPSLWPANPADSGDQPASIELDAPPPGGSSDDALEWIRRESVTNTHIHHQFLFAAFDSPPFVAGLQEQGFRPTAYLPAWMPDGDVRRDCVLMVKRHALLSCVTRGFDRSIDAWDRRLERHLGYGRQRSAECDRTGSADAWI